jgi:hypothetical protein
VREIETLRSLQNIQGKSLAHMAVFRYAWLMPSSTTIAKRVVATAAATLILLLPALWNGFPFLTWGDSAAYITRWFEGTLSANRSATYGLFVAAGSRLDFWPVLILQAAAAVWVIGVTLRIHRFNVYPAGLLAIIATLAVTTALPWLSSTLMPDIFAGPAVLAFHALVWHGTRIGLREAAALVVFIAFAVSTHSATYAVLLALAAAALLVSLVNRELVPRAAILQVTFAMALGAVMLLAGNYLVAKRITWTPGGFGLAFASMLENGIVTRYLDDHCPDQQLTLCQYRNELPRTASAFLWHGDSVFNRLGRFDGLGHEMRRIVLGSLRDYPGMQIKAALIATAKQFLAVGTGEGIMATPYNEDILERYTPSVVPAMRAARQQRGAVGFRVINFIHRPLALAATAFLPLILIFGLRSAAFTDLGYLAATISIALLANAAVCGAIVGAYARLGSRIVWIAAFVAALVAWRAFVLGRERREHKIVENSSP